MQDIGVAGNGSERDAVQTRTAEGQIVDAGDNQLVAFIPVVVKDRLPADIGTAGIAAVYLVDLVLLLGFGIPLLLLIGVLLMVLRWTGDEGMAALASLGALLPYYIVLWLLHDSIGQRVSFQIDK